jgi:hypothetical protein
MIAPAWPWPPIAWQSKAGSADEAMNEMRALGFTGVHHEICPGLARYEKSFPHRLQTGASFKDLRAHGSPALSK